jgi:hypothetical protein
LHCFNHDKIGAPGLSLMKSDTRKLPTGEGYPTAKQKKVAGFTISLITLKEVLWEKSYLERLEEYHLKNHPIPKLQLHQPMEDPSKNNRNGGLVGDYGGGVYVANFSGGNYGVYEAGRGRTGNDGPFGGRY